MCVCVCLKEDVWKGWRSVMGESYSVGVVDWERVGTPPNGRVRGVFVGG